MEDASVTSINDLTTLEKLINTYEEKIGLEVPGQVHIHIKEYLSYTRDDLQRLTLSEICEICVCVNAALVTIQKELNKHKMRTGWVESQINLLIAHEISNYSASSFQERRLMALKDGDLTFRLEKLRIRSQAIIDDTLFIIQRIDGWLKSMDGLRYAKQKPSS